MPHQVTGIDPVTFTNRLGDPVLRFEAYLASILGFDFELIPLGARRGDTRSASPAPDVRAIGREALGPARDLTVECSVDSLAGTGIGYACHAYRVFELSTLTITIAWLAQELPLTDVSIDMRILNDVARRSENPPDYIPRGYTAGGKRIDR